MQHPFIEPNLMPRCLDSCVMIIFGATGDLTERRLLPALYNLKREGMLPSRFACIGFARREKSHEFFREEMKKAVKSHLHLSSTEESLWQDFQKQIFYHRSEFENDKGYEQLKDFLLDIEHKFESRGNRLYYLATQPAFFPIIIEKLKKHQLLYKKEQQRPWSRVIIEKPFGQDLASATALQKQLTENLDESQLYRIDHYLGKETVQNLLVFRFANSIFENLWNYRYIDHIQFTVAENSGIGRRGHFYEQQGLVRDIMQNHMMQILSLITMDPPVNLSARAIHNEKVKVLEAIRPFTEEDFRISAARGQYDKGYIDGEEVKAYREEENVSPSSTVETFGALRLFIDNWRWTGVPFYLRGGKYLAKKATEIAIVFKEPPGILFGPQGQKEEANVLTIRIQPNEGISLKINCKVPGATSPIQGVKMDFRYGAFFGFAPPDAYERLLCDAIAGDNTLFARDDEVLLAWQFFTPLLNYWAENKPSDFPNYAAGSWGPKCADEMIGKDKRKWRLM